MKPNTGVRSQEQFYVGWSAKDLEEITLTWNVKRTFQSLKNAIITGV
jgi:hypothetical protein